MGSEALYELLCYFTRGGFKALTSSLQQTCGTASKVQIRLQANKMDALSTDMDPSVPSVGVSIQRGFLYEGSYDLASH